MGLCGLFSSSLTGLKEAAWVSFCLCLVIKTCVRRAGKEWKSFDLHAAYYTFGRNKRTVEVH